MKNRKKRKTHIRWGFSSLDFSLFWVGFFWVGFFGANPGEEGVSGLEAGNLHPAKRKIQREITSSFRNMA